MQPEPSSPNYLSGDFPPSTPRASWYSNEPSDRASSPFLHPTVSRLRSFTPQTSSSRVPSLANSGRTNSGVFDGGAMLSHSPSHLSALSSASSVHSGFVGPATAARLEPHDEQGEEEEERQVFRWTSLRNIGNYVFSQGAQKAASILGKPALGKPTVIAANGMICIGTDQGRVVVYDFKQNLKCVCGTGPVDASTSPGELSQNQRVSHRLTTHTRQTQTLTRLRIRPRPITRPHLPRRRLHHRPHTPLQHHLFPCPLFPATIHPHTRPHRSAFAPHLHPNHHLRQKRRPSRRLAHRLRRLRSRETYSDRQRR